MEERFHIFTLLITNINRAIHKIKTEEMAEFELRSSHVSCLYYLYRKNAMTAKDLCAICEEDKANISRAVKFLEANGFLVCRSRYAKRYQSPLALTEKGQAIGERIAKKIDSILAKAGEGIEDEERGRAYAVLTKILTNLQKICDDYREGTG